jgi:hypothetical protein
VSTSTRLAHYVAPEVMFITTGYAAWQVAILSTSFSWVVLATPLHNIHAMMTCCSRWCCLATPPSIFKMQIQFAGLPHYEEKYEDFVADATVLRRRFTVDGAQQQTVEGSAAKMQLLAMEAKHACVSLPHMYGGIHNDTLVTVAAIL